MHYKRPCFCSMTVLLVLAGCDSSAKLATVQCHVTRDRQPLSGAEMRFDSSGDDAVSIGAVTLDDGSCFLDLGERAGLPPGDYNITVTLYETKDGAPLPSGEEGQALKLDRKSVRKQYLFQRALTAGTNSLELRIEEGQEIAEPDDPESDLTE